MLLSTDVLRVIIGLVWELSESLVRSITSGAGVGVRPACCPLFVDMTGLRYSNPSPTNIRGGEGELRDMFKISEGEGVKLNLKRGGDGE